MNILSLRPILAHKTATAINDTGRNTKNGRPEIPTGAILSVVSLLRSHVPSSDDLLTLVQSMRTRSLLLFLFLVGLGRQ